MANMLIPGRPALFWMALGVLAGGFGETAGQAQPVIKTDFRGETLPLEKALKKATVNGKYEMLLQQFKVEKDGDQYGTFRDLGLKETTDYAGFKELPKGHWVYVYPYWYIWRDLSATPKLKRAWGPEQATGPPDTHQAGDIQTAWASLTPDQQKEWLLLEYAGPVVPEAVSGLRNLQSRRALSSHRFPINRRGSGSVAGKGPYSQKQRHGNLGNQVPRSLQNQPRQDLPGFPQCSGLE
jgi:hypothetical protein